MIGPRSARSQRLTDRRQDVLLRWKPDRVLPRHPLLADPHRELAPVAFDQFGLFSEVVLENRRHTGGAREIVSDLAVANTNQLHQHSPLPSV